MQIWKDKVQSSDRYSVHSQLKDALELEMYLAVISIQKFRNTLI